MSDVAPIYIPSKGRHDSRITMRALDRICVPYYVIVEEQEWFYYASVIDAGKLLVLDPAYQRDYDALMELGPEQSRGSGPARNFAWDHAAASGAPWHWTVDDNIHNFYRLNQNMKIQVHGSSFFRVMEHFVGRYENVAMAGPHYEHFVTRRSKHPPFVLNTRIYSCNLIRTDVPFRWRGRYNEDTILSLDMLKAGYCTVLFKAFLQKKSATLRMKGGNTDELYKDGTEQKSEMLAAAHPDVARVVQRFNRAHHHVDYDGFTQRLKLRAGVRLDELEPREFMRLQRVPEDVTSSTRKEAVVR
jgi:hypothetical protein